MNCVCCLWRDFARAARAYESLAVNMSTIVTPASPSFYRRTLPTSCIAFDSPEGIELFRDALNEGGLGAFFKLAAVYQTQVLAEVPQILRSCYSTQAEPSYCGIASLAMVLNSLDVDPQKNW
jgi:glutathione gamma-glutamylcysteinyltransferase